MRKTLTQHIKVTQAKVTTITNHWSSHIMSKTTTKEIEKTIIIERVESYRTKRLRQKVKKTNWEDNNNWKGGILPADTPPCSCLALQHKWHLPFICQHLGAHHCYHNCQHCHCHHCHGHHYLCHQYIVIIISAFFSVKVKDETTRNTN